MSGNKVQKRQQAIKELIKSQHIDSQESLVALLSKKYSIATTQSIVSRDLYELGVGKQKYQDTMVYELNEQDASKEILRLGIVNLEHNESLIVITVLPGLAAFVGDYIDVHSTEAEVMGTIAGENMLFVTPRSIRCIDTTFKKLCQLLYFKPKQLT